MIAWRAFYADGSVYDSDTTPYEDLPREGMVGVVEYEGEPYRKVVQGADWYWFSAGRWHKKPTGAWGTWKPKPGCCDPIRSTTRLADDHYESIHRAMLDAPYLEAA